MDLTTSWTQQDFIERIEPLGLIEEDRPPEFRQHRATLSNRSFEINSTGWDVGGGRACARSARITGPGMDIATVMLYPTSSPDLLPVFAAEWVVFGPNIHTLVLDVEVCGDQPALTDDCSNAFKEVHQRWVRQFPLNRDKPAWFEEIETPWALFGKATGDMMATLRAAFQDYLAVTMDVFYSERLGRAAAGEDHRDVQVYKQHHYINSPGHRILGVKFGEVHTDRLLKDWHFGPAWRAGEIARENSMIGESDAIRSASWI